MIGKAIESITSFIRKAAAYSRIIFSKRKSEAMRVAKLLSESGKDGREKAIRYWLAYSMLVAKRDVMFGWGVLIDIGEAKAAIHDFGLKDSSVSAKADGNRYWMSMDELGIDDYAMSSASAVAGMITGMLRRNALTSVRCYIMISLRSISIPIGVKSDIRDRMMLVYEAVCGLLYRRGECGGCEEKDIHGIVWKCLRRESDLDSIRMDLSI